MPDSNNSFRFSIKVVPNSAVSKIAGWLGDDLKVQVNQPAENGKANMAVTKLLAATLGINQSNLEIVSGTSSSRKIIKVTGFSRSEFENRLGKPR